MKIDISIMSNDLELNNIHFKHKAHSGFDQNDQINVEKNIEIESFRAFLLGKNTWFIAKDALKQNLKKRHKLVIASNLVAVKDIATFAIVGGNLSDRKKPKFSEKQIRLILFSKWWSYSFTNFQKLDIGNKETFTKQFEKNNSSYPKLVFKLFQHIQLLLQAK